MKKLCICFLAMMLMSCAYAGVIQGNIEVNVPKGLTEHEAEIWREGYACGYYDALNPVDDEGHYVLNTKSHKFHLPSCNGVAAMSEKNRQDFYGTRDEAIEQGYEPCGNCNP